MKKILFFIFILLGLLFSCNKKKLILAEYSINGKNKKVYLNDIVKYKENNDFQHIFFYRHKEKISQSEIIIQEYILSEIVYYETQQINEYKNDNNILKENQIEKDTLIYLYGKGVENIYNNTKNDKILKNINIPVSEFSQLFIKHDKNNDSLKKKLADESLNRIIHSDNSYEVFIDLIKKYSNDPEKIKIQNGNIGPVIPGVLVSEVDNILFASNDWAGFYPEVITSSIGYHIIYRKKSSEKLTINEIKNSVPKSMYKIMIPFIEEYKIKKSIENYTCFNTKIIYTPPVLDDVIISKQNYFFNDIPSNTPIILYKNKSINWEYVKKWLLLFEETDINLLTYEYFDNTIKRFLNFYVPVQAAIENGHEKDKAVQAIQRDIDKKYAISFFSNYIGKKIQSNITWDEVKNYYDINKDNYSRIDEYGKEHPLKYESSKYKFQIDTFKEKLGIFLTNWRKEQFEKNKIKIYNKKLYYLENHILKNNK